VNTFQKENTAVSEETIEQDTHCSAESNPKTPETAVPQPVSWRKIVAKYQKPILSKSLGQIANTFIPFAGLWVLMYFTLPVSLPLTIALAVLAGCFLMRIFIIFHDCGHGSYFRSKKANNTLGFICGLLTLTPYRHWRWQHAVHHGVSGNLDERGIGDVWTMTVNEYLNATLWERIQYRITRNPLILFGLIPLSLFVVYQRFSYKKASQADKNSVHIMNLSILLFATLMSLIFGFWNYVWIQLTVTAVSGTVGVWLFYVQHQFEDTYWRSGEEWDYTTSAMQGSSFYKLPKIMQWFSGNIGYHHIHHLSSRIPNYSLEACHNAEPFFQQVPHLTIRSSLKSLSLRMWDEDSQKLVGYSHLKDLRKSA
jgi:omega-6 fatty acid desaturase (delta-12 desaturase)